MHAFPDGNDVSAMSLEPRVGRPGRPTAGAKGEVILGVPTTFDTHSLFNS